MSKILRASARSSVYYIEPFYHRSHGNEGKVPHNVVTPEDGRAIADFVLIFAKKNGSPVLPFSNVNSTIKNLAGKILFCCHVSSWILPRPFHLLPNRFFLHVVLLLLSRSAPPFSSFVLHSSSHPPPPSAHPPSSPPRLSFLDGHTCRGD